MATGIHSQPVKEEFKEHAREEQEHAERIAERIKQLGGKPEMDPAMLTELSHSEYREGKRRRRIQEAELTGRGALATATLVQALLPPRLQSSSASLTPWWRNASIRGSSCAR